MTTPIRYTKRPVTIEAVRLTDTNAGRVLAWIEDSGGIAVMRGGPGGGSRGATLTIRTLEGDHLARVGDWIIRGVRGEFYPCKPGIFAATYEPAAPDPLVGHPRGDAIRTIARHALADAADGLTLDLDLRRAYGAISDEDWEAVTAELQRLTPSVDGAEYCAAYQVLTDAAGEV